MIIKFLRRRRGDAYRILNFGCFELTVGNKEEKKGYTK